MGQRTQLPVLQLVLNHHGINDGNGAINARDQYGGESDHDVFSAPQPPYGLLLKMTRFVQLPGFTAFHASCWNGEPECMEALVRWSWCFRSHFSCSPARFHSG